MTSGVNARSSNQCRTPDYDLLLRETNHRCANDLQLVVSLLSLQSRRATNAEARAILADATARVAILARTRAELNRDRRPGLATALRQVSEALHSQAEPRSILISMRAEDEATGLSQPQVATLALVVNELATNAIKHAFEEGKSGHVVVIVRRGADSEAVVVVDDDGPPFPEATGSGGGGLGLDLVKRLVASIGGRAIRPDARPKCFELRAPIAA